MPSYAPGFGAGPFGLSPFGIPAEDWSEETPTVLRSSRKVNLVTGKVEVDDDGNFEGMDDIGQRVVLAVKRAKIPPLQGISFDEEMQQEIRRVLTEASLTTGLPPDIDLYRKDAGRTIEVVPKAGGAEITVHYRNNVAGSETSVMIEP
jgi:hypothetical protein